MKKFVIAIMFCLLYQPVLWAEESNFSKDYQSCLEAADGANPEIWACIDEEIVRQDKRLNLTYQKLMKLLPENRQTALKEAQRAWVKFRDAYADYLNDGQGGTMASGNRVSWLLQSTANQADRLEAELAYIETVN